MKFWWLMWIFTLPPDEFVAFLDELVPFNGEFLLFH